MANTFEFSYGTYNFRPRPLLSIQSEPRKSPDGTAYGIDYTVSLEGDILLSGVGEVNSGINGVFKKIEALKSALSNDGECLTISCGSGADSRNIISGYPTIESYSFNNESDNYVQRAAYSIEMKMPTLIDGRSGDPLNDFDGGAPFIESCSETWDVDAAEGITPFMYGNEQFGYKLAVTHTVDVKAKIHYTGANQYATVWEQAKVYATGKLGFDSDFVKLSGILNLPGSGFSGELDVYNHFRKVSTNKTEGSINIVETFVVTPQGTTLPNSAYEDFDISLDQADGIVTVGIQGNIQGLVTTSYTGDYSVSPSTGKLGNAEGYYAALGEGTIYDRAVRAYSGLFSQPSGCEFAYSNPNPVLGRPLNPQIRNKSVAINPRAGTLNYNYTFDSAPSGIFTGGGPPNNCIISQNVSIDDQFATDVFASQVVLGRAAGPILQDIGTTTARTRSISIELVTMPPTGVSTYTEIYKTVPTTQVDKFISTITGSLSAYSQVFISQNTQNWNLTTGRYTKSFAMTYNTCTG